MECLLSAESNLFCSPRPGGLPLCTHYTLLGEGGDGQHIPVLLCGP